MPASADSAHPDSTLYKADVVYAVLVALAGLVVRQFHFHQIMVHSTSSRSNMSVTSTQHFVQAKTT